MAPRVLAGGADEGGCNAEVTVWDKMPDGSLREQGTGVEVFEQLLVDADNGAREAPLTDPVAAMAALKAAQARLVEWQAAFKEDKTMVASPARQTLRAARRAAEFYRTQRGRERISRRRPCQTDEN